ncbi:hypothetical protein [Paremcibacter congregatus]|uniref:Uncharacterized protein n=1 Tax=Paremcibacter congregatus TaxID=2043170 RepID=A0A2G4YQM3_9PROT|nr:hypothetical protein [Paremcibacter congregatus]PHZ84580.1 hypothetical protein CRD36_12310 [Paremcibacter congregatus]QDE28800.1 hypothetical protein FIV45_16715 [Paremcibacter congregatus]
MKTQLYYSPDPYRNLIPTCGRHMPRLSGHHSWRFRHTDTTSAYAQAALFHPMRATPHPSPASERRVPSQGGNARHTDSIAGNTIKPSCTICNTRSAKKFDHKDYYNGTS